MSLFGRSKKFRQLLEALWERLYRVAFSWTHDSYQAHDLVQETIARALQQKDKITDERALEIWLFRVMANYWHDQHRRKKEFIDITDEQLVDNNTPDIINTRLDLVEQVRMAISKLNPDQRQVLTLIIMQGFSYEEVAEILNIPVGTVMSRICRARQNIRKLLSEPSIKPGSTTHLWRIK